MNVENLKKLRAHLVLNADKFDQSVDVELSDADIATWREEMDDQDTEDVSDDEDDEPEEEIDESLVDIIEPEDVDAGYEPVSSVFARPSAVGDLLAHAALVFDADQWRANLDDGFLEDWLDIGSTEATFLNEFDTHVEGREDVAGLDEILLRLDALILYGEGLAELKRTAKPRAAV